MNTSPAPARRKHLVRTCIVAVAVLALIALGLGFGDVVRAAFEPPSAPKPYDPLPAW